MIRTQFNVTDRGSPGLVVGPLVLVVVALLATPGRPAAAQSCTHTGSNLVTDLRRSFRTSTVNLGDLSGVSATETRRAIAAGASVWNEQSNARPFRYLGDTVRSDLPMSKSSCDLLGINYSLVRVVDEEDGNFALLEERCIDPNTNIAHHFVINLYVADAAGVPYQWSIRGGTIQSNQLDLVGIVAHEFGHSYNVGHPPLGQFGVMSSRAENPLVPILGESRYRELYRYDLNCAKNVAGDRQTRAKRRLHGFGSFNAEEAYLGTWTVAKVSSGFTYSPIFDFASAGFRSGPGSPCLFWERGQNTQNFRCMPSSESFVDRLSVFTEATFLEDSALQDRLFFATFDEFPAGSLNAVHQLRFRRSSDGFVTSTGGTLSQCGAPNGFMTCSSIAFPVNTGLAPAVSFDDYSGRSVFVWANQDRGSKIENRQVRVAVGSISHTMLPPAANLGVQTVAAPGIACKSFAAANYDCMVAAVSQEDTGFNIQVRRFWAQQGPHHYFLQMDPNVTTISGARTAGRIAAWYRIDEGAFYLAYRSLAANQPLVVLRSTDTLSWTTVTFSAYSDIGPSAASYTTGINSLVYVN